MFRRLSNPSGTVTSAKGSNTVPEARKVASKREQVKYDKYKEIAKAAGMSFYPLVHEAYGRVGIQAHNLLKACVAKIAALKRQPVASVFCYWCARFSLSLQISQARAIHERFRDSQWIHSSVHMLDQMRILI